MSLSKQTMEIARSIATRVLSTEVVVPNRMKSHLRQPGERRCIHRGEGDDFDGHEIYAPGDDPRTIDWNATAMTGGQQVLVALYKEEAQIKSVVLCDISPTMDFGTTRATKRILAAELAACTAKSLAETHDPLSLVAYSFHRVERRLPSGSPASMLLPVTANVLDTPAIRRKNEHSGLAKALSTVPRSPSLLFVISDFMHTTRSDWEALRRAGRRHRIHAMFVQDLRERELPPPGLIPMLYPVRDTMGQESLLWVTNRRRREHARKFKEHEASILERLGDARASFITVSTEEGDAGLKRALRFLSSPSRKGG